MTFWNGTLSSELQNATKSKCDGCCSRLEFEKIDEEVKKGTSLALFFLQEKSQNIS